MSQVGQVASYPGSRLLEFVENEMTMTSYYQPVVISALVEAGGNASRGHLASRLMHADPYLHDRFDRILMRWPLLTLRRRGIADYNREAKEFVLPVLFESNEMRTRVLDACTAALDGFRPQVLVKRASRAYQLIEQAGGRCQACGVPGHERPLDIDHVVPMARASRGQVILRGTTMHVDDPRNMQVLCTRCNRGKRDTSEVDFRPGLDRLAETIAVVVARAEAEGIAEYELMDRARSLAASIFDG